MEEPSSSINALNEEIPSEKKEMDSSNESSSLPSSTIMPIIEQKVDLKQDPKNTKEDNALKNESADDINTKQNNMDDTEESINLQAAAAENVTQTTTPLPPVKIKVHFQAVGSAPILRKTKFAIGANEKFAVIPIFLRKHLQLDEHAPLFVYCNSAFCPNLDQRISDLFEVSLLVL